MSAMPNLSLSETDHVSLCEVLDRVLNKGVVIQGDVMISVAGVDLVYLKLQLLLTSVADSRVFQGLGSVREASDGMG